MTTAQDPGTAPWRSDGERVAYHGLPILQPTPWKQEIGWYLFTGGLAGGSSVLALSARIAGHPSLARHARRWALAGLVPSPVLLVLDLGVPSRFLNMLRVIKPTSPMSVGSWLLAAYGPVAVGSAALDLRRRAGALGWAADALAGVLGAGLTTYTAVLVSNTATPVWHEARRELPPLFAASAAASAGAASVMTVPAGANAPARTVAVAGAATSLIVSRVMERRLGAALASARRHGAPGRLRHLADAFGVAGSALLVLGRRQRIATVAGGFAILASSVCERFCVLESGKASAADPAAVLATQRDHHAAPPPGDVALVERPAPG